MNILSREKQIQAIAALCEGVSIRATERLCGVNRGTVMTLGARVGEGCAKLHNRLMRDLNVARLEFDEIWQYVGKHRKAMKPRDDPATVGDQYTFVAISGTSKAIISYYTGKRTYEDAYIFARDVRSRVLGAPEISCDGLSAYPWAIQRAFAERHTLGVIVKNYAAVDANAEPARRYSPGDVVSVERKRVVGEPMHISTSYIERQNLTLRMSQRRFTRLTNAFSKKFEHHCAAIALYAAHFNFCRVHEALRITPAMQLGITDHVWTIGELIAAALDEALPPGTTTEFPMNLSKSERIPSGRRDRPYGTFRVIDGGKNKK